MKDGFQMWALPALAEQATHWPVVLDVIDKVTKILAVIVGAGWVYLNYLRGRTFKHRLEPSISGKTIRRNGVLFVLGLAQVKNVGLSKVLIEQRGTAIEIVSCTLDDAVADGRSLTDRDAVACSVFEAHGWIEPGEQIEESFLLPVAEHANTIAFRVALRIVSEHIEWNADSIVEIVSRDSFAPGLHSPVTQAAETDERAEGIKQNKDYPA